MFENAVTIRLVSYFGNRAVEIPLLSLYFGVCSLKDKLRRNLVDRRKPIRGFVNQLDGECIPRNSHLMSPAVNIRDLYLVN